MADSSDLASAGFLLLRMASTHASAAMHDPNWAESMEGHARVLQGFGAFDHHGQAGCVCSRTPQCSKADCGWQSALLEWVTQALTG
jgi:hypothetical protein